MPAPQIPLFTGVTPNRNQSPNDFSNNADDWLNYQSPLATDYNDLATYLDALALTPSINDLSITYTFPTVATFKASLIEFPDGKIIHLLDRGADFTKISGTGTANSFNIIASTSVNQSIDYIPKDVINIRHMGSDNSGALESFGAIKAAHELANSLLLSVVGVGSFKVTATSNIPVKTNFDYSQATFNIPDSVSVSRFFDVQPTVGIVTVNTPPATNFFKGNTIVSDFVPYKQSVISINSGDTYVLRNGVDIVKKRDVIYHSEDGHISHALFFDMTVIDNFLVNVAEKAKLLLRAPNVVIGDATIASFIYSERNTVTCEGGHIENNATGINRPIVTYFEPHFCMDNVLDGRRGDPLSPFNQSFAYDYSGGSVLRPTIRNVVTPYSWGGLDGNVFRDTLVERCVLSRAGVHALAIGMTVRDTVLMEKGIQVTGGGTLKVERVTKTTVGSDGSLAFISPIVDLREDFGGEWDGDIIIEDFTLDCGNIAASDVEIAVVRQNFKGDVNYGKDIIMPKRIFINRGRIITSSNAASDTKIYIVETFRYPETQTQITRTLPGLISIKDVKIEVPTGSPVVQILPYRHPNLLSGNTNGNTKIVVDGVDFGINTTSLPLSRLGRTLDIAIDSTDFASINTVVEYEIKNSLVDFIFSAPASWTLQLDNCKILNGDAFDGGTVLGAAETTYRGCTLFPGVHAGGTPRLMYDCYAKALGGSVAVNVSGEFKRASGNSIQAGVTFTAGTRTTEEWVNGYHAPDYFESVAAGTTAEITDITNAINTSAKKVEGFKIYNVTTHLHVVAAGNADGSLWVFEGTGNTAHTPV